MTPFFFEMITLNTNTADQIIRLTLNEGRQYFATPFTHYMISLTHEENSVAGIFLRQVANVISENQRITELLISTESLIVSGRYRYEVYGQNSSTNTDPNDASVVGEVEIGWMYLINDAIYYDIPEIEFADDVIYQST